MSRAATDLGLIAFFLGALVMSPLASQPAQPLPRRSLEDRTKQSRSAEVNGLKELFKGITPNGQVEAGLFAERSTGVSTEPVRKAAAAFLDSLTPPQRQKTTFALDDDEWRKWMNQHFYVRQGVSFDEMSESQREAAFGLLRASLSAKGLKLTRDIMRLNHTLGELNDNNFDEYGEWTLPPHRHGHAVGERALGMAVRRPPRDHQLLRARRSGGDDAAFLPDRNR